MNSLPTKHISLSDYKRIINEIKDNRGVDLSKYTIPILKRRMEIFYENRFSYVSIHKFLNRLLNKDDIFESFLNFITMPTTEMFRDPIFWKIFRDRTIKAIQRDTSHLKIWVPQINSADDELITIAIVLYELNLFDNVEIVATSPFSVVLKAYKESIYIPQKKFIISNDNYLIYNDLGNFGDYFVKNGEYYVLKNFLLKNIKFEKFDFIDDIQTEKFNLIFFRNRMLFFNLELYNLALEKVNHALDRNGYLIIGYNETLERWQGSVNYMCIEKGENIFRKKLIE